jgi:chemotaxis protein methyltransferase CheR/two-component system CheB/CheR fusion protein
VHQATGIDFSSYKEDTLLRRLEKRKSTLGIESADAYQAHIRQHPDELKTLQHLFLVSVSSFFRDRESFNVLNMSLAKLVAGKRPDEPVRAWVPGCASGEEPLTLAILLKELAGTRPVEILATDLNPEALALAREGNYRTTAFKEMEPMLRERYFTAHGQHFQASAELHACIRYEQRDVLGGIGGTPPANLDLVSCRNLLIYMKSHLQDQLIKTFHTALRSQGLLFIGQSESLSFVGNSLFVPIDHYHRLFRRRH